MEILFDSRDALKISDKELFKIWKKVKKMGYIYINAVSIMFVILFIVYTLALLNRWNVFFIIYAVMLVNIFLMYKNIPVKFRDTLLKVPNYVFYDDFFYVGNKQLNYTDIDMLEIGCGFARIKMEKYKLVLIFKDRDKVEMDTLVTKLKANAKRCREI